MVDYIGVVSFGFGVILRLRASGLRTSVESAWGKGEFLNCGHWAGVMLSPAAGKRAADLITWVMEPQDNPGLVLPTLPK